MWINCPICENRTEDDPIKVWNYNKYVVKKYVCRECGDSFNIYFEGNEEAFTLPKRFDRRKYK